MKRLLAIGLAGASLPSIALAQTAAVPDLTAGKNAFARAETACRANKSAKCLLETQTAIEAGKRALTKIPGAVVVPGPTPTPTPVPAPAPSPSPTPNPAADGKFIACFEGDSYSVDYLGYFAGKFKGDHPEFTTYILAVGGSGLANLEERRAAMQAKACDFIHVLVAANDLGSYPSAQAYFDREIAYVAPLRAQGSKVVIGSPIPISVPANQPFTDRHNAYRKQLASLLRAAVGTKIDGLVDYANLPQFTDDAAARNPQLMQADGVHPTEYTFNGAHGGHGYLNDELNRVAAPFLPSAPPVAGYVPSPTLDGAPDLVAAFPVSDGLIPSWGTGAIPGLYGAGEGAFRFTCGDGHMNYDDPLVLPGQSGKAHLHGYWGPTNVTAATTMATLAATTGSSTCNYGPKTLNRSAYWAPKLLDEAGYTRNADWIAVYYKRPMASSPRCTPGSATFEGICIGLPNQIRYVFGWDQFHPDAPVQGASWYCTGGSGGHFKDLDAVFASGCKAGDTLVADMAAPDCWDGKYLDSPDHRSHTAYADYSNGFGYLKCPASHPYVIPQNESKVAWTVTADMYETIAGVVRARLHLSSDHMKPGAKPGETLHSDYMEQWVEAVKRMWEDACINKGLDCSGGDLGNGLQLIGASQPSYGWINPNPRTPIP